MTTRSADATIKGYYYQFDTSILKLLELASDTDSITIEGIEDIDINKATDVTTIQCKYLSKPRFINSAVREPITLMLDHFVTNTTNSLNYVLYAHFEHESQGTEPNIDLEKLKEILTYTEKKVNKQHHIEKNITDEQLNAFLEKFSFVFGKEFDTQQKEVIQKLKTHFNCSSDFEADTLYYNNALRVVIDKAIKKQKNQRKITKGDFIKGINTKKRLFNEWFIKLRSKKEYLKNLSQNLKSTRALEASRAKIILIGKEIIEATNTELPVEVFIENLIAKYYKINSALRDAKPLSLVLDCDEKVLKEIKSKLIKSNTVFNDGFEHINFSSTIFNAKPVITKSNNGAKITNSSYLIKLISKNTFDTNFKTIEAPTVFICFSQNEVSNQFSTGQFFDYKYCETFAEIFQVLTK
ncbi:DUF4297 family anti-phage-associated protein [Sphingobacterium lactis]|uniref:DUF4297 family anti-phage-associated protein n=1 Tax=Sphingobacterium lactis TaxID=797291 RepID=UPI003F7E8ABD